jgi:hypothetical protein
MVYIAIHTMPTYKFDVEGLVIKRYEMLYEHIMFKDVQLDIVDYVGNGYFIRAYDDTIVPDQLVGTLFTKPGSPARKPKKAKVAKPPKDTE